MSFNAGRKKINEPVVMMICGMRERTSVRLIAPQASVLYQLNGPVNDSQWNFPLSGCCSVAANDSDE